MYKTKNVQTYKIINYEEHIKRNKKLIYYLFKIFKLGKLQYYLLLFFLFISTLIITINYSVLYFI